MAVFFGLPDADVTAMLAKALAQWHPDLRALGVRVQILFAASDTDAPAVKHGGYPALATVRIVPLKDRLTKGYDAEMLVCRESWGDMTGAQRMALLDHELSHIEPVKKEVKQAKGYKGEPQYYTPLDDLGRPKLKLRPGDWCAGDGFDVVVARHGDDAAEFEGLRRAWKRAKDAAELGADDGNATASRPGGEVPEDGDGESIGIGIGDGTTAADYRAAVEVPEPAL